MTAKDDARQDRRYGKSCVISRAEGAETAPLRDDTISGRQSEDPPEISRRQALRLLALAGLLAGCGPLAPTQAPAAETSPPIATQPPPSPTVPPPPTTPPPPTVDPQATPVVPRPAIVRHYPPDPSRVVVAHHSGAWRDEKLVPEVLGKMLDASIVALTGLADAATAWSAVFAPTERIAIKVNTIYGGYGQTHPDLVYALTGRLEASGIPPEQIVIFDRGDGELKSAGYTLNPDGPGVRCTGTGSRYTEGWTLVGQPIGLSDVLLEADAVIDMPILKEHNQTSISFAMKNYWGLYHDHTRSQFHNSISRALVELHSIPAIRDRTRLIVGDALSLVLGFQWYDTLPGDAIVMSFDPVAHDAVGLQMMADKVPHTDTKSVRVRYLALAQEAGLGASEAGHIERVDLAL